AYKTEGAGGVYGRKPLQGPRLEPARRCHASGSHEVGAVVGKRHARSSQTSRQALPHTQASLQQGKTAPIFWPVFSPVVFWSAFFGRLGNLAHAQLHAFHLNIASDPLG